MFMMLQYCSGKSIHRSFRRVKMLIIQLFNKSLNQFKTAVWTLAKHIPAHKQFLQRGVYIQYALDFLFAAAQPNFVFLFVFTDFVYDMSRDDLASCTEQGSWVRQAINLIGGVVQLFVQWLERILQGCVVECVAVNVNIVVSRHREFLE